MNDGADGAEQWPMVGEFHVNGMALGWQLKLNNFVKSLRFIGRGEGRYRFLRGRVQAEHIDVDERLGDMLWIVETW